MLYVLSTIHWPFTLTLPFSNNLQSNATPKYFNPQPHDCSNMNDTQSSFQYPYEWLCISISIPDLPGLGCLILLTAHTILPCNWHQISSMSVVVYHVETRASDALFLLNPPPSVHCVLYTIPQACRWSPSSCRPSEWSNKTVILCYIIQQCDQIRISDLNRCQKGKH